MKNLSTYKNSLQRDVVIPESKYSPKEIRSRMECLERVKWEIRIPTDIPSRRTKKGILMLGVAFVTFYIKAMKIVYH